MASAPTTLSRTIRTAAPGRVNLIGEHTDYNGGFVLPTAIPQQTHVTLGPRPDYQVVARSANSSPDGQYTLGGEQQRHDWLDYVQGVTWALAQAGHGPRTGFELDITSEVPLGGGVSSSAALEVSLLRAIRAAFSLELDDVRLALLGQKAENDFVGARCGIMDQMAASLADSHTALFLDTRSLEYEQIPLPGSADLVVIHSGVTHRIAHGEGVQSEYNIRRAQCEEAALLLGVSQLRDANLADLSRAENLSETLKKRARHVITEDQRVLDAVGALKTSDMDRLGELFFASHASMRDDFEVSVVDVDRLVELGRADPDVFGARMTGGGFGGAVVMLVRAGQGQVAGERIARRYSEISGRQPTLLVPAANVHT
jgi:galactokinase